VHGAGGVCMRCKAEDEPHSGDADMAMLQKSAGDHPHVPTTLNC